MNCLELKGVSKSYGSNNVLSDVSLTLEAGQVTAIVGDNGAGKSTLLKVIAGIVSPDNGMLLLNGVPIDSTNGRSHRDQGIEMVYQDLALAKQHDVVSNFSWDARPCLRADSFGRSR